MLIFLQGSTLISNRGGLWELAGSCVGCPIDGIRGLGVVPPPSTAECRWLFADDDIQYHSRKLMN